MRFVRVFATGFVLHFKNLSASPFMVVTAAIWPLVYATLAFLMFRATHQAPSLLYAALGAAVMGIWSTTATSAGGAIQQQRNWKVLELLVGAPSPLILVLAPVTVAIAGIDTRNSAGCNTWNGTPKSSRPQRSVVTIE